MKNFLGKWQERALAKEQRKRNFPERAHPRTQGAGTWLGRVSAACWMEPASLAGMAHPTTYPAPHQLGLGLCHRPDLRPEATVWWIPPADSQERTAGWNSMLQDDTPNISLSTQTFQWVSLSTVSLSSQLQRDGSLFPQWGGKAHRGYRMLTLSSPRRDPRGDLLKWQTEPGLMGIDLELKDPGRTWGTWISGQGQTECGPFLRVWPWAPGFSFLNWTSAVETYEFCLVRTVWWVCLHWSPFWGYLSLRL